MNIYFQDIMERIRMHYKKMTNTERIIADFFLSNTEKMEFSAKAVAARLHVSEPAMTRFSKKSGFPGIGNSSIYMKLIFRRYSVMMRSCCTELLIPTRKYCCILTAGLPNRFTGSANLYRRLPGFTFSPWAAPPARRGSSSCVSCGWGFWWKLSTIRT